MNFLLQVKEGLWAVGPQALFLFGIFFRGLRAGILALFLGGGILDAHLGPCTVRHGRIGYGGPRRGAAVILLFCHFSSPRKQYAPRRMRSYGRCAIRQKMNAYPRFLRLIVKFCFQIIEVSERQRGQELVGIAGVGLNVSKQEHIHLVAAIGDLTFGYEVGECATRLRK